MKFVLQGVGDLMRNLERIGRNLSPEVERRALRMAAEPIRAAAEQLCPRSTLPKKEHMQDHIIIADTEAHTADQESSVDIGPEEQFFYGRMIEFGTSHSRAQPFMRPAFDQNAARSMEMLGGLLWVAMTHGIVGGSAGVTAVPDGAEE